MGLMDSNVRLLLEDGIEGIYNNISLEAGEKEEKSRKTQRKYLFHIVLQKILQRMRTDNRHLRTWPHTLHCSYKGYWNMESVSKISITLRDIYRTVESGL